MRLIGNALNDDYFLNLVSLADNPKLQEVRLAVAYVSDMNNVFALVEKRKVPLTLYALMDGDQFPSAAVLSKFVRSSPISWRLFLTANYYHPKIYWFRGIGAYIGSANLSQGGWTRNLECGIWLSDEELHEQGLVDQLSSMFEVIAGQCEPAAEGHIAIRERLAIERKLLRAAQERFSQFAAQQLKNLPGQQPLIDATPRRKGGTARALFVQEWNRALTLLRKLARLAEEREWPSWVEKDVHPAIAQDQATEYWYRSKVRGTGDSAAEIERLFAANRHRSAAATDEVFDLWLKAHAADDGPSWINVTPKRLNELLQPEKITEMGEDELAEILWGAHASREHARQIRKYDLGLARDDHTRKEERCRLFARYLLGQRTPEGQTIQQVLRYVLWGDAQTQDCAERIWNAVQPQSRIPHLGKNILGELVGYARPDDFPPRNDRVSRSLRALGFEGVAT